jgi:adenine-specific DNA methylase
MFAGGGAIPLEALRLGCEAHASDLNPVAVLILKCTVEYPQKYGQPDSRPVPGYIHELDQREAEATGRQRLTEGEGSWAAAYRRNPLATDVRYWGQWVLERAREVLAPYYPHDPDGKVPVAYLWARTVRCPNPACGAEMPLIRQYWLARKDKKKVALEPVVDRAGKIVRFRVVEGNRIVGDPGAATTETTGVRCVFCEAAASGEYIRYEGKGGRLGAMMTAVIVDGGNGKSYREPRDTDAAAIRVACDVLADLPARADGLSWIPGEPTPPYRITGGNVAVYGFNTFGKLFNSRQLLALATFARLVGEAYDQLQASCSDPEYAKAVATYLGCAVDKLADFGSSLASWNVGNEQTVAK